MSSEKISLITLNQPDVVNVESQGKPTSNMSSDTYQKKIFEALKNRNFEQFNVLLVSDDVDIDYIYSQRNENVTCLTYAIINKCGLNFVHSLLRAGADCNKKIDGQLPLHLAIKHRQLEIVERLLREKDIKIGILKNKSMFNDCDTPLNFLIKYATQQQNSKKHNNFYIDCIKVLLQNEEDPNIPDADGKTAIANAVEKEHSKFICLILDNSQYSVDINKYKCSSGKTLREEINEKKLYSQELQLTEEQSKKITQLFIHIRKKETKKFITCLNTLCEDDKRDLATRFYSLLRHAVKKELGEAINELLKWRKEANCMVTDNKQLLIDWACYRGNTRILTALLDNIDISERVLNSVAVKFIQNEYKESEGTRTCVKKLLTSENMPINSQDIEGNTILYYVAKNMDEELMKLCLQRGASVAVKNKMHEFPLVNINHQFFEDYLNTCVTKSERRGHDVLEIDFSSLEPCKTDEFKHEMELFRYMENDENYKMLLKHPIIETYIVVKCHRMRLIFLLHFIFYFLFCCVVFMYSYSCVYEDEFENSTVQNNIFYYILIVFTVCLFCLELSQMRYIKQYFRHFENFLDIAIIILCTFIIFNKHRLDNFAIVNVLCVIRLAFHLAKFKLFSTHISMLKTVSGIFLKYILCYSLLILTFSWSFIIIFKNVKNIPSDEKSENKTNYFDTMPLAFFKSFIMLTGEYDIDDMPLSSNTSYIIVILFIFLISIVLFNLLNGLAVSDIQMIKNDAKLYAMISLIEEISFQEDYFFIPKKIFEKLNFSMARNIFMKFLLTILKSVYIFPDDSQSHKMYILYNVNKKIIMQLNCPDKDNVNLPRKLVRSITELTKKNTKKDGSTLNGS